MTVSNMNLRVGVLLIGSLIWDEECCRQKWRNARLKLCDRVHVKVPIRYGRKSSSRGDTYTMVFSNEMSCSEKIGLGIAVPCVRNIQNSSDLIAEAEALWAAESKKDTNRISARWGCIGIVCNPNPTQKCDISKVKIEWLKRVESEIKKCPCSPYTCHRKAIDENGILEISCPQIDENGILKISWPQTETGEPYDGADILLATATSLTIVNGTYPSPKTIAEAWRDDTNCNIRYFKNNQAWGIRTSEDDEIKKYLKTP